ncbi:MAG: ATP-binding protein [Pseudomonadota bacterium]
MSESAMRLDLKGKFVLVIVFGALALLANICLVYFETSRMNHTVTALELTEDIYNNILEMRRYEKNFLLFHDQESMEQARVYLQQAQGLLQNISLDRLAMRGGEEYGELASHLQGYSNNLERLRRDPGDGQATNDIRAIGKKVVDIPEGLLKVERRRVSRAALSSSMWPLTLTGSMLLLFIAGAYLVTKKVITPLARLERATEHIAQGDFRPIPQAERQESQVDRLVAAFNHMAQELEARQEQIIHSRKIASLGTLVSGIAHELNNPINNIILTIDTLVEGSNVSEDRRKLLLDDILKQALRSSEIVKNLLDFSRAETQVFKELDLAAVLKETLQLVGNQIALSKVTVRHDISEDMPAIVGNRQGLQQVFLNLVINAIQAMPQGGDLTLLARCEQQREIVVEVRDTGQGISEENLSSIFDPFFTTKEVGKGTGLGLSVSYGVVKKHGGQITVASKLGQGTTFKVVLPVREQLVNG